MRSRKFLICFALIVLLYTLFLSPTLNIAKFLTGFFAYGRSNGQLILFCIWVIYTSLCLPFIRKKMSLPIFLLPIAVGVTLQITAHIFLNHQLGTSALSLVWVSDHGFASVNSLIHIHAIKPVIEFLAGIIGAIPERSDFDAGYAFIPFIPSWLIYAASLNLVVAVIISPFFVKKLASNDSKFADLLLFSIAVFTPLKLMIDGGVLNPSGVVWLSVLIFLLNPHHFLSKLWIFIHFSVSFLAALYTEQSLSEWSDAAYTFLAGVILRAAFAWLLFSFRKPHPAKAWKEIVGAVVLIGSFLTFHPWVGGDLMSFKSSQKISGVYTSELPAPPWILGDTRSISPLVKIYNAESLSSFAKKRRFISDPSAQCEKVKTRTVSADIKFIPSHAFPSESKQFFPGIKLTTSNEVLPPYDMRIIVELPGCFPISKGIQNSILFLISREYGDVFLYAHEKVWN